MKSLNRWIVLYCSIITSYLLLMIIPEENYVFRAISITLVSIFSVSYYIFKRYSQRLTLQTDLLISINTLAQFLLPVLYLAFFYQFNPDLDNHNFRYGYAITSFAALIGQTAFYFGYESIGKSYYFPRINISKDLYKTLFPVLFFLIIIIWLARFVLLLTGSYYHLNRTEYQFTSAWFSIFSQISDYGLLIVIALFFIAYLKERKTSLVIALIVFGVELLWYISGGMREATMWALLAPIAVFILVKGKIPRKMTFTIIMVAVPLLIIMGASRYIIHTYVDPSYIDIRNTVPILLESEKWFSQHSQNQITSLIDRIYDGKSLGYLLMHFSNDYNYKFGKTYKNIIFTPIPRFLYLDKPVLNIHLNDWYVILAAGSMPLTFWGECYINFSWFGIIFISYLLGLAMKSYDYFFAHKVTNPYFMYLYVFSALYIIRRLPMHALVIWISFLLKVIILAFIFASIHSIIHGYNKKCTE